MYFAGFVVLSAIVQVLLLRFGPRGIHVAAMVVGGAILSVIAYQAFAFIESGVLDPFFQIAALVEFGVAIVVGAVIAFLMRRSATSA